MISKFNTKQFQGKGRLYRLVPGAVRIQRLWVWDQEAVEYRNPPRGKCYLARRYEVVLGKRKRVTGYFETLEEARNWQAGAESESVKPFSRSVGPILQNVIDEWKERHFPGLAEGTRLQYEKLIRLHFWDLLNLPINDLTPHVVDGWLVRLKADALASERKTTRKSFEHELTLLTVILKYYGEYRDDPNFRHPVKARHRKAAQLNRRTIPKQKDMSEDEFLKFREELSKGSHADVMVPLATVQYYQALRVSEAAALHWEDILFDAVEPVKSRLRVVRSAFWPRKKGMCSEVRPGFKNSKACGGVKYQPLFRGSYEELAEFQNGAASGLIFQVDGQLLEYRQIQYAYDSAFKRSGLPYSATHVMRHGGCSRVYNQVVDIEVAKQHLGNQSTQTTMIYAKRSTAALTEFAAAEWGQADGGRNGSQSVSRSEISEEN